MFAEEHPYWAAVRKARGGVPRYQVDEPAGQAALRSRVNKALVEAPQWLPDQTLGQMLSRASTEAGVSIVPSAEAAGAIAPTEPGWLHEPGKLGLSDWLDLTLALAETRPQWEVQGGAIRVAALSELLEHAREFEYRLDDFRLNPADFFAGGEVPEPIYGASLVPKEMLFTLADELGDLSFWEFPKAAEAAPAAINVSLTPRGHLRVQAGLDRLRSFRIPLPGEGAPGESSRTAHPRSHRRAYALVREAGGVSALLALDANQLIETLRTRGKKQGVGVLWTAAARERLSQPGPINGLIFEVIGGCVCVFADGEGPPLSKQVLWMDLRDRLDGGEFDAETLAATPHLEELRSGSEPLLRSLSLPADYCRRFIAQESWDSDPDFTMRVTQEGWLVAKHRPWVLDEIENLMVSWRY